MKIILALVLGVISAMATAKEVTYTFSGTFDTPDRYDPDNNTSNEPLFLGLVTAGGGFTGQVTFDTTQATHYDDTGTSRGVTYKVLDFRLKAPGEFNAAPESWKAYGVTFSSDYPGIPDREPDMIRFGVQTYTDSTQAHGVSADFTFRALSGTFTKARPWDNPGQSYGGSFDMYMQHNNENAYDTVYGYGQIQMTQVSPVPEPSSAAMMLAALAGIGGVAALRRR
jgi:hypothetical protein